MFPQLDPDDRHLDRLVDVVQAGRLLGEPAETFRRWHRAGKLTPVALGKTDRPMFTLYDIAECWLNEKTAA